MTRCLAGSDATFVYILRTGTKQSTFDFESLFSRPHPPNRTILFIYIRGTNARVYTTVSLSSPSAVCRLSRL